jgi:hypothetical protein
MKKLYFLVFLLFGIFHEGFAQTQTSTSEKNAPNVKRVTEVTEKEKYDLLLNELKGTFQFQIQNNSIKPVLSVALLENIKSTREQLQATFIDLGEGIVVYIPSQSEIDSPNYQKIESVIYKSNVSDEK